MSFGEPSGLWSRPLFPLKSTQSPLISRSSPAFNVVSRPAFAAPSQPSLDVHGTGGLLAFPGPLELQSQKECWTSEREEKKREKENHSWSKCGAAQLKPDESSLFLPFPLPRTHQAHPVSLSEDGLVMVFYRADGTKMFKPPNAVWSERRGYWKWFENEGDSLEVKPHSRHAIPPHAASKQSNTGEGREGFL